MSKVQPSEVRDVMFSGPALEKLKTTISKDIFGMTVKEAHAEGVCVQCKEPAEPKCYSDAGREEYEISGMCERCFDQLFGISEEGGGE